MRLIGVSLIVGLLLWVDASALAQRRARVSRPSEQTGSAVLGRIGGRNTLSTSEPESLRGTHSSYTNDGTRPLAIPGLGQRRGSGFYAGALSVGSASLVQPYNTSLYQIGQPQIFQARQLSGLNYAESPQANIAAIQQLNRLPGLRTPTYLREAGGTAFHAVFGLTPADHSAEHEHPEAFPSDVTQADLMEANLAAREKAIIDNAVQAFTRAMDERPWADRLYDLKDAESRLRTAVELKVASKSMELNLCLLHIDLELEQIGPASSLIDAAIKANPRLFIDRLTIAKQMGDYDAEQAYSKHLEDQFHRYVVTASYNSDSIDAHILTGYCAVFVKDWRRLQVAVDTLQDQLYTVNDREPIDRFLWAVKPVIEQRP